MLAPPACAAPCLPLEQCLIQACSRALALELRILLVLIPLAPTMSCCAPSLVGPRAFCNLLPFQLLPLTYPGFTNDAVPHSRRLMNQPPSGHPAPTAMSLIPYTCVQPSSVTA